MSFINIKEKLFFKKMNIMGNEITRIKKKIE